MPIVRILETSVSYLEDLTARHVHLERGSIVNVPDEVATQLIEAKRALMADAPLPPGPDFSTQPPPPKQLPILNAAWRVREGVRRAFGRNRRP